jgi:Na+/citrate or Na+/malate symporter
VEDLHHISPKPSHQGIGLGILGQLAEVVLITGVFAIIMVLLVEALTEKRDVSGIGMGNLSADSGAERIEHSSSAHHKGKTWKPSTPCSLMERLLAT